MSETEGRAPPPARVPASDVVLRPEAEADAGFLCALFTAVHAPPLAASGVPAEVVAQLVAMQFRARADSYGARFPSARRLILESGGRAVGRLLVEREARDLYLVDVAVHPEAQDRGFGGAAVAALQREAAAAGLGVRALVMPGNGCSLALFRRRGFAGTGRMTGPSIELRWTA